jgi:hypothetical protein
VSTLPIPSAVEHYLLTGCYHGADLDLFLLAGAVMRNQLDALERLWGELGAQLKSRRRGEAFAEMALRIRDWRQWPDTYGCQERTHTHEVPNTRRLPR